MAGRTADISTSSFKPLSLNEIMMVPLAKQKMEDQLLTEADKFNQLSADVLDKDTDEAERLIGDYKSRASSLSDEIIDRGVDRAQFHKLRSLRSELNNEEKDGFLGRARANKKSATEYINALATDKQRQAGWSPQEAKMWAQQQVRNFSGTRGADGNFAQFSGAELAAKVDEDEFLKNAADLVKGKVSQKVYDKISVEGLPAFYDAFQSQEISGADFNTVMSTLVRQASTSPELLASLKQRAFFNNEKDPLDFGRFDPVKVKQPNGEVKTVYNYVPGKSRFAQKMLGVGQARSGKDVKIDTKFVKNDIKLSMLKDGYDQEALVKLYKIQNGEYLDLSPADIPEIRTMNNDERLKLGEYETKMNEYKNLLMTRDDMTEEEAMQTPEYQRMLSNYTESKVNVTNSDNYIKGLEENAKTKLEEIDRSLVQLGEAIDANGGSIFKTAESEFNLTRDQLLSGYSEAYLNKFSPESIQELLESEASRAIAREMGIKITGSTYDITRNIKNSIKKMNDVISDDLNANRKGIGYKKVNMPKSGKYSSSKYRVFTDLEEEFLNTNSVKVLGTEVTMTVKDYMNTSEFTDVMEGVDTEKGFEIKKSFTIDGYNQDGVSFDEVIIRSKADPTKMVTIQVPTENPEVKTELYESLVQSGDFKQRLEGQKGLANQVFMSPIKKSNLRYNDKGNIFVDLPGIGSTDQITYERVKNDLGDQIYKITMFGEPVEFRGKTEFKSEQEISLALHEAYKEIVAEMASQKRKEEETETKTQ